jgi:hypothetical protein
MVKKTKYKITGVIEFISASEAEKFGYTEAIETHPVIEYKIEYSYTAFKDSSRFWKPERLEVESKYEYKAVYEYLVKERYSIQYAQEKFPELFL